MTFSDKRIVDFQQEILRLFLFIAFGVSCAVVPIYYAVGIDLTFPCMAYLLLLGLIGWQSDWRVDELRYGVNIFLGATLLLMLSSLNLGAHSIDNNSWQLVFPIVAFSIAGARRGVIWSALGLLGALGVIALHWSANMQMATLSFVLAHLTITLGLYGFASRNEQNIQTISRLSHTDTLTKVYNRQLFDDLYATTFNRARRADEALAVFMIDVDYFKSYNETYGHPAGDRALTSVAEVIRSSARRATDLVFRYGGEEFCVISSALELNDARAVAEKIIQGVRRRSIEHTGSEHGQVTVSIGLCFSESLAEESTARLLDQADRALYIAKKRGRDRTEWRRPDSLEPESVDAVA